MGIKLFNKFKKKYKNNKFKDFLTRTISLFCISKTDIKLLILSLLIILHLDLGTKYLAFNMNTEEYYVCSFLNFLKVKNYGISFGIFHEYAYFMKYFIIMFNISIITFLLHFLKVKFTYKHPVTFSTAVCLIISGAIGNLFDRIYYGFVRDFIDFHIGNYHWPCFNVSDIFICIGVGMFIICDLLFKKK